MAALTTSKKSNGVAGGEQAELLIDDEASNVEENEVNCESTNSENDEDLVADEETRNDTVEEEVENIAEADLKTNYAKALPEGENLSKVIRKSHKTVKKVSKPKEKKKTMSSEQHAKSKRSVRSQKDEKKPKTNIKPLIKPKKEKHGKSSSASSKTKNSKASQKKSSKGQKGKKNEL